MNRANVVTRIEKPKRTQPRLRGRVYAATFYAPHLPPWHPDGAPIFLTWHLAGSLPAGVRRAKTKQGTGVAEVSAGKRLVIGDRAMDRAAVMPWWLRDPRVAERFVETLVRGDAVLRQYRLHA